MTPNTQKPENIGQLRRSPQFDPRRAARTVKDELRENLLCAIERKQTLFAGIHGFEETVIPQVINAILSRHNFILLGLRGRAKSRILRGLANLLDAEIPYVAGCEIHDHPFRPLCRTCRERVAEMGDDTPMPGWGASIATWKNWPLRNITIATLLATSTRLRRRVPGGTWATSSRFTTTITTRQSRHLRHQ